MKTLILLFSHLFGCWKCWWWQWWDDLIIMGQTQLSVSHGQISMIFWCVKFDPYPIVLQLWNEQFFTVSHTVAHIVWNWPKKISSSKNASTFYPDYDAFYPQFDAFKPHFWCILSSFLMHLNNFDPFHSNFLHNFWMKFSIFPQCEWHQNSLKIPWFVAKNPRNAMIHQKQAWFSNSLETSA